MKYTFLNLYILSICNYEATAFLNWFTLSELKFTRILEGSLFHNIAAAALKWNVFLPKFVFNPRVSCYDIDYKYILSEQNE